MTRTDLIKLIWRKVQSRKYHPRGWPQPPEHWIDMKYDGWYDGILDEAEKDIIEDNKPILPSVAKDRHEDEVVRREMKYKGAISMIKDPGLHENGLKSLDIIFDD